MQRRVLWVMVMMLAGLSGGCATDAPAERLNPSFSLTVAQAQAALREMQRTPAKLPRPVVVLGGFADPGLVAGGLKDRLRAATGDQHILSIAFFTCGTFDECRDRAVREVQAAFPSADPAVTTEVDVVAVSMGGVVARYAAMEEVSPQRAQRTQSGQDQAQHGSSSVTSVVNSSPAPRRRLKIARLFTISTPHRGAALADLPTLSHLQKDMRAGSPFMEALDAGLPRSDYELFCYVRLNDRIVGATHAAPAGATAWWVPNRPLEGAHLSAGRDPRIVADIARRLRGEAPYAANPPAPLPEE